MYARILTLMTVACPWPLLAQTAPATATAPAPAAPAPTTAQVNAASANSEDQTFVLSPFEVSSSTDHGYETNETLAGTRIRTNLNDVAASISVMNKQFLTDIGALDNGTLLQYTTNAEVAGTEGTYSGVGGGQTFSEQSSLLNPAQSNRVRGLAAADNTRDYYITDIPWDSYNVDRIDILRGPNSFLYGLGSPAGIVNASLNNAEFRNFGNASIRFGSYGSTRSTVDVNQDVIHNVLAIRIDGMYDDRKYDQSDAFQNQKRIYAAIRFDPNLFGPHSSFHTSLKAKVEGGDISADRPRITPPNDSITPFFRPTTISASNPYGGMGGQYQNNPYDPWRTDGVVPGNGRGTLQSSTTNFQPWLTDTGQQQQPYWLFDGNTNALLGVFGGYINNGARDTNGNPGSISAGLAGKGTNMAFMGLTSLNAAASAYNLPGAVFGQYKTQSLEDPSVFNFYDHLIDGPTKSEWERWTASNIDLSETAFDDRLGLDVSYDRQRYFRGGQALLGYSPTLNIDIDRNNLDYYLNGSDGETSNTNANVGRPYVTGASGSGGSSYRSIRQVQRASLFGELRATDFIRNDFWAKVVGLHRFNIVASNEQFWDQNLVWEQYANSQQWDGLWNQNTGNNNPVTNRPPQAFIYLGPSLMGRGSAHGANIPGVTQNIQLQPHGVYLFDSTYNSTQPFNAPWSVPANLQTIYEGVPSPLANGTQLDQNSNPSNYVGWNSNFQDNIVRSNDGSNPYLWTTAEQSFRETISYAGNYQAYLWKNAIVGTFGWRYDEVETKDVTAPLVVPNRNTPNLAQFNLPNSFPLGQIFKNHSTSEGIVVHLNDFIPHDPLPVNIGVSYNNSNNFQVTSVRRDVYGSPIDNPDGKTKEYGLILSTKDDRLSLRIEKYDTKVENGSSTLGNPAGIGSTIAQGLRFRNVFLYQLGGYTLDTENQPQSRNNWAQDFPSLTAAQAQQQEDQAIDTWNAIEKHLLGTTFFQYWNFTPTQPSQLVNRTTYLTNPAAFQPDPTTVGPYSVPSGGPQGFTVTADTESKGYEFDLTANPTRNWRMEFNASEDTATESNVGGAGLNSLVTYLNSQLDPGGVPSPAAIMPQFGNAGLSIQLNQWGPWLQNYTLLKLQEGSNVSELRKWRFNWINSYDFTTGFLRGWGVGGAWRWQDKNVIGYPVDPTTNSFILSRPYYGPPVSSVDAWVSYTRRITNKIGWKIQLNVTNLLGRNGLIPVSVEPDGSTWAAVRVKPIQEWAITNSFTF
ncbi:MAG TPA: TonB-dependent receptor plug domain-containing protein [Opitutaceae bacterium]|nr:TonB-dependent receptor plug domain-containing protein [Opitutaceae bacterium]